MNMPIRAIIGLGNPGKNYHDTRHNAGAWFVTQLAASHQVNLANKTKFHGALGELKAFSHPVYLFIPATYMNESGRAVQALCHFYKLTPKEILIVHDELDLTTGTARIKLGGGHGGHNGLRDIIAALDTTDFYRLRIGISHPGVRSEVTNYILSKPSIAEKKNIDEILAKALTVVPDLVAGKIERAMKVLHTKD